MCWNERIRLHEGKLCDSSWREAMIGSHVLFQHGGGQRHQIETCTRYQSNSPDVSSHRP